MPQAVTHLLVPLVIGSWIKDWYESRRKKKRFSLHYVLIAGIGGILPDIDIAIFWILHWFGFTLEKVHRTFTHTIFLPLLLFALYFIFRNIKIRELGRHKLKVSIMFLMLAFGSSIHLMLDAILSGQIVLFYPFLNYTTGLDLIGKLPYPLINLASPCLDGALLVLWIIYLEWKHKVSDFI